MHHRRTCIQIYSNVHTNALLLGIFYLLLRAPPSVISKFRETSFQTLHKTKTWSKIPANLTECDQTIWEIFRLLYRQSSLFFLETELFPSPCWSRQYRSFCQFVYSSSVSSALNRLNCHRAGDGPTEK